MTTKKEPATIQVDMRTVWINLACGEYGDAIPTVNLQTFVPIAMLSGGEECTIKDNG